ncbi:hypothetical protein TA3x_000404 [Tundrisphaera sp. TA3]|uniref:hypothetical protein n=1 Tax=Tundrisphaera sp. TA3 TaxID=3435775 RepID=UPI003EBC4F2C
MSGGFDLPMPDTEPFPGETLIADGWQYRDTPPMLEQLWDELLGIIGEGNYRLLTLMKRTFRDDDRLYKRGQMLISPAGIENLKARANKECEKPPTDRRNS